MIEGLNQEELEEWSQFADSKGLTLAEFIRRSVAHAIDIRASAWQYLAARGPAAPAGSPAEPLQRRKSGLLRGASRGHSAASPFYRDLLLACPVFELTASVFFQCSALPGASKIGVRAEQVSPRSLLGESGCQRRLSSRCRLGNMHLPTSGMGVESESLRRPDRRMAHKRRDVATMIQGLTGPAARSANVPPAADDYGWLATAGPALRSWRAAAFAEALDGGIWEKRDGAVTSWWRFGCCGDFAFTVVPCAGVSAGMASREGGWTCAHRSACATRRRRRSSGRA
jgi:hypothetical protein